MPKIMLEAESLVTVDGNAVPFSSLDEGKQRNCTDIMLKNLGRTVSEYLSENPREAKEFFNGQNKS